MVLRRQGEPDTTDMVECVLVLGNGETLMFYTERGISDDDLLKQAEEICEAHQYDPDLHADLHNIYRRAVDTTDEFAFRQALERIAYDRPREKCASGGCDHCAPCIARNVLREVGP